MAAYLLRNDGLFLGSSAAMNCVGAVKSARALMAERGHSGGDGGVTVVTVLCDGGQRHLSKFQSAEYLAAQGLAPHAQRRGLEFVGP